MKKIKRIMSLLIALTLAFTSLSMVSFADSTENTVIAYDGTITENEVIFIDGVTLYFERQTKVDGTTIVSVTENGKVYTKTGKVNYQHLKDRVSGEKRKGDGIALFADEHIANCYHRTLATNYITVTREEGATSAAAITAILASAFTAKPNVIAKLAKEVYGIFKDHTDVAYEEVVEEVNEVFFSSDNVYYTHCYHDSIKAYGNNEQELRSYTHYYQSVGG